MEAETYEEFINNILNTRGRFACGDEYHERHHIVPKCMDGGNEEENLIDLFAKEHFIAHRLFALENPDNEKLVYAYTCMAFLTNAINMERYELTPSEYEDAKITYIELISGTNSIWYGTHRYGVDNPMYGKHHTEDAKKKMRQAALNRSDETLNKLSQKATERLSIPENNPMYGRRHNDESRKKQSDKAKERFKNPADHPMYGVHRFGKDAPRSRPTMCLDTKVIYDSAETASRQTGIDNSAICKCCKGTYKTAGGYKWKALYDIALKDGTIIPGAITLGIISEKEANKQLVTKN